MEIEELDETSSVNKSEFKVDEHKPDKNLRKMMREGGGQQARFSFNYEP